MSFDEPVTIGLSNGAHGKLQRMKEDGHFAELMDGYRLAIGLALAYGVEPAIVTNRNTMFNIGSLDPDRSIYHAVQALRQNKDEAVYRTAERLAEWGVEEMYRQVETGTFSIVELLQEAEARG